MKLSVSDLLPALASHGAEAQAPALAVPVCVFGAQLDGCFGLSADALVASRASVQRTALSTSGRTHSLSSSAASGDAEVVDGALARAVAEFFVGKPFLLGIARSSLAANRGSGAAAAPPAAGVVSISSLVPFVAATGKRLARVKPELHAKSITPLFNVAATSTISHRVMLATLPAPAGAGVRGAARSTTTATASTGSMTGTALELMGQTASSPVDVPLATVLTPLIGGGHGVLEAYVGVSTGQLFGPVSARAATVARLVLTSPSNLGAGGPATSPSRMSASNPASQWTEWLDAIAAGTPVPQPALVHPVSDERENTDPTVHASPPGTHASEAPTADLDSVHWGSWLGALAGTPRACSSSPRRLVLPETPLPRPASGGTTSSVVVPCTTRVHRKRRRSTDEDEDCEALQSPSFGRAPRRLRRKPGLVPRAPPSAPPVTSPWFQSSGSRARPATLQIERL